VHATFFVLLAWIGWSAWATAGPASAAFSVAFVLALFACVVLHEFGHALMARRYGIATTDITLLPIGGLARLERMPEKPAQEIAVAVAGPAVNVAIFLVLVLVFGAGAELAAFDPTDLGARAFVAQLAAVNLLLVLFNLVPAFPMDGGRVLRAVLSHFMGRSRGTEVAARAGQVIAFGFGFLGLASGNVILLLIAVFVFMAAAAESAEVATRERVHDVPAREAMITSFETLAPDDTMHAAGQALVRTTQGEFPVLDPGGRLVGVLTRAQIVGEGPGTRPVSEVMTPDIPVVALEAPLEGVLDRLGEGSPAVGVTDRAGHFLGYVTRENFGEWLVLNRARTPR
jgi:stage IV sporulation protein FB